MRVLLDENIPRKLKREFTPEHKVVTVQEHGWSGVLNGTLLRLADTEFDAFVTLDRGIEYQRTYQASRFGSWSSERSRTKSRI